MSTGKTTLGVDKVISFEEATKVKGQKNVKASDRKILNELVEIMQKRFGEAEEKIHPSWKNYFEKD